ncbi:TPA: hypothetical protein DCZ32_02445 [Candidatus Uhrbacteria bacterium]|nr:hypothetical protein [Candidatus Uhrbacteria bacterium]
MNIEPIQILFRLILAAVLCGIIGFEREYRHKPAGIRTNALVGIGTALFTIVSISFQDLQGATGVDPSRVASTVLTGIGFIGAGTIMQSRGIVKGLTTAASIWVAAAIGMAIGMGLIVPAIIAEILVIIVLVSLRNLRIEEEEEKNI